VVKPRAKGGLYPSPAVDRRVIDDAGTPTDHCEKYAYNPKPLIDQSGECAESFNTATDAPMIERSSDNAGNGSEHLWGAQPTHGSRVSMVPADARNDYDRECVCHARQFRGTACMDDDLSQCRWDKSCAYRKGSPVQP
jgi:hypothetical protein